MENSFIFFSVITLPKFEKKTLAELKKQNALSIIKFNARSSAGDLFTLIDQSRVMFVALINANISEKLIEIFNEKHKFKDVENGIAFAVGFDNSAFLNGLKVED